MTINGSIQQKLSQGSALQKYRFVATGNRGFKEFLFYEFYTSFLSPLPGKFGIYARRLFFLLLFKQFGHKSFVKRDVTFRRPHQISIGNGVTLETGVTLDVKGNDGFIKILDDVHIGSNTIISCPGGIVSIGTGTHIGANCRLGSLKGLTIGQHSRIEDCTCIVGAGHAHQSPDLPIIKQPLTCKGPTVIGDFVTIGKGVTLLDGVSVGRKSTILAESLVNKNIAPNCSSHGVPASLYSINSEFKNAPYGSNSIKQKQ